MSIGSPTPPKTIGQPFRVFGDLKVVDNGIGTTGDIKTREHNVGGGGSLIVRHVYAGPAGGLHIEQPAPGSSNDFTIAPDANPASNILFKVNGDVITWGSVEIATGKFTVDSLLTDIDAGITFGIGNPGSGVALATNAEARSISNMDFTVTGWRLLVDVAGPIRLQVFKQTYGSYDASAFIDLSGTSTGSHGAPRIALGGGVKNTDSNLSGWTVPAPTIGWGDCVRAIVTANSGGNGWFALQLYGRRNVKKT